MLRVLITEVVLDYAHIMLTSAQICPYSVAQLCSLVLTIIFHFI